METHNNAPAVALLIELKNIHYILDVDIERMIATKKAVRKLLDFYGAEYPHLMEGADTHIGGGKIKLAANWKQNLATVQKSIPYETKRSGGGKGAPKGGYAKNNPAREFLKLDFMSKNHTEIKEYIEADMSFRYELKIKSLCKRYREYCGFSKKYTGFDIWRAIQKKFVDPPLSVGAEAPALFDVMIDQLKNKEVASIPLAPHPLHATHKRDATAITSFQDIDYFGDLSVNPKFKPTPIDAD